MYVGKFLVIPIGFCYWYQYGVNIIDCFIHPSLETKQHSATMHSVPYKDTTTESHWK